MCSTQHGVDTNDIIRLVELVALSYQPIFNQFFSIWNPYRRSSTQPHSPSHLSSLSPLHFLCLTLPVFFFTVSGTGVFFLSFCIGIFLGGAKIGREDGYNCLPTD